MSPELLLRHCDKNRHLYSNLPLVPYSCFKGSIKGQLGICNRFGLALCVSAMLMCSCASSKAEGPIESVKAPDLPGANLNIEDADIEIDEAYLKPYPLTLEDEEEEEEEEEKEVKRGKDGLPLPEGPESDFYEDNVLVVVAKDLIDDGYTYYKADDVAKDSYFLGTDDYYFYRGFLAVLESEGSFKVSYNFLAPLELVEQTVVRDFDCSKIEKGNMVYYKVNGNDSVTMTYDKTIMLFRFESVMPYSDAIPMS